MLKLSYSDGADHEGVATFRTLREAEAFAKAVRACGYKVMWIRQARMVRASKRRSWFFEQEDTFEG